MRATLISDVRRKQLGWLAASCSGRPPSPCRGMAVPPPDLYAGDFCSRHSGCLSATPTRARSDSQAGAIETSTHPHVRAACGARAPISVPKAVRLMLRPTTARLGTPLHHQAARGLVREVSTSSMAGIVRGTGHAAAGGLRRPSTPALRVGRISYDGWQGASASSRSDGSLLGASRPHARPSVTLLERRRSRRHGALCLGGSTIGVLHFVCKSDEPT